MIDSVVFDLDGTLWDTCATCAVGWNNVLRRHGIAFREITAADIRGVTGRPHEDCIRQVFTGLPAPALALLTAATAAEDVRLVSEVGGALYPGVTDGVRRLHARLPLFIVSNCQAGYIETFLAWSGLEPCFRDVECWGNTGLAKAANLARVIQRNGLGAPVFVGTPPATRARRGSAGSPSPGSTGATATAPAPSTASRRSTPSPTGCSRNRVAAVGSSSRYIGKLNPRATNTAI